MHQINSKKIYRVEEMLYSFYLVEPLCKKRARDGKMEASESSVIGASRVVLIASILLKNFKTMTCH